MPFPDQNSTVNLLLRTLQPDDYALLGAHFERVAVEQNQVLAPANQPIEYIYFPEGGIVSLTADTSDNGKTEVGIVGREGLTGIAVLLGSDRSPHETFVQVDGNDALRIGVDDFRRAMTQSESLRTLMLRYVQAFFVQSAQSTVSNAHHRIESRLARWLLMCHDRIDGDDIRLTHEFMSMMIAAQRTGVTVCLHILEGGGLIRSKRSLVQILDRDKLEDLAADAYGAPEAEYRRLIGPFGRTQAG